MRPLCVIFHIVLFVHVYHCEPDEKRTYTEESRSPIKISIDHLTGLSASSEYYKDDHHCHGVSQSPVDLSADAVIASYGNIKFIGFKDLYNVRLVILNGFPEVTFNHSRQIIITEGGLKEKYYLHNFKYYTPPFHTVAGARYAGEGHFTFINTKYSDYETARVNPDGIAILAVFTIIGTTENLAYNQYLDALMHAEGDPPTYDLPLKVTPASGLPYDSCSFFRYRGKTSRHSCKEIITWTIFVEPIEITEEQHTTMHDELQSHSEKSNLHRENIHTKPRIIDLDSLHYKSKGIVTLQPRIFCKSPFVSKEVLPWFLFHKF